MLARFVVAYTNKIHHLKATRKSGVTMLEYGLCASLAIACMAGIVNIVQDLYSAHIL